MFGTDFAPLAGCQPDDVPGANAEADQAQRRMADRCGHTSHLAVFAFFYRQLELTGRSLSVRRLAHALNWHSVPYGLLNRIKRLIRGRVQKNAPSREGGGGLSMAPRQAAIAVLLFAMCLVIHSYAGSVKNSTYSPVVI